MAKADVWRDLADKFRTADPLRILRADWNYKVRVGEEQPRLVNWELVGTDDRTRSIRYEFEALARRAGPEVHPYMDSLHGWLEALRQSRLNADTAGSGVESEPDGKIIAHLYFGTIHAVCEASADLCKAYESVALETERMLRVAQEARNRAEKAAIEPEFFDPKSLSTEDLPVLAAGPATTKISRIPPASRRGHPHASIGQQIEALRQDCRWSLEKLAEMIGKHESTVKRHIAGKMEPTLKTLGVYEKVFSKQLGKQILIHKTPPARL